MRLPYRSSRLTSVSSLLAGPSQKLIRAGLVRLGVQDDPRSSDFASLLHSLCIESAGEPVSGDVLTEARLALRQLRHARTEDLRNGDLAVPTLDRRILPVSVVFIPDDPRVARSGSIGSIALVEDNEDARDVAKRAGARSLTQSLETRLRGSPPRSLDRRSNSWTRSIEGRLRSKLFGEGLHRLLHHEALGRPNDLDDAHDRALSSGSLAWRVAVAKQIVVDVVLPTSEGDVLVLEHDPSRHFDETQDTLWIRQASRDLMLEEVVRGVCEHFALSNQLCVGRMLQVEPDEIEQVLDDREIAMLHRGQVLDLSDDRDDTNQPELLVEEDAAERHGEESF